MILTIISAIIVLLFTPPVVFASSLQLNELMVHPSSGNDWIELYNGTANSIDLTNWTLVDSTSTMKTLSGTINSNGFANFDVSNRLNNGGDSVYLKDSTGTTLDSYTYSSDPGIDYSLGRQPDGGSWITLSNSSQGASNGGSSPAPTTTPTPLPTSTPTPTPTKTPTPTPTPKTPTSTPVPTTIKTPTTAPKSASTTTNQNSSEVIVPTQTAVKTDYRIASVAGITASSSTTPSATIKVEGQKLTNFLPWIGGILILSGLGSLGYIYLRNRNHV